MMISQHEGYLSFQHDRFDQRFDDMFSQANDSKLWQKNTFEL